jgi:hypothetical protein
LLHAVIPILGIIAFIPAFLTALGIGSSFLKFVTPLSYPAAPGAACWPCSTSWTASPTW